MIYGNDSVRQHPRLSLIHISEPTRLRRISYAVFCLKKKKLGSGGIGGRATQGGPGTDGIEAGGPNFAAFTGGGTRRTGGAAGGSSSSVGNAGSPSVGNGKPSSKLRPCIPNK